MKALSVGEKFELIRHHGDGLARTGTGARSALRSEVLESAQRIIELAKSIPKLEWGVEDSER